MVDQYVITKCLRNGLTTMFELERALRLAKLEGSLEQAMQSPALAMCLRNIVHAHHQDGQRHKFSLPTDDQADEPSEDRSAYLDLKCRAAGDNR